MSSASAIAARLARWGRRFEDFMLVALLAAIVLLAGAQIVVRNGGGGGLIWSDQVLRILVLWVAMFGAVAAARDNNHAVIDLVVHRLPDLPKRALEALVCAATAAVCGFIAWTRRCSCVRRAASANCCSARCRRGRSSSPSRSASA